MDVRMEFDSYGDATEETLLVALQRETLPEGWTAQVVPGSSSEPAWVVVRPPSGNRMADDERTTGILLTQDGRWEWGGSRGYTEASLADYIARYLNPDRWLS